MEDKLVDLLSRAEAAIISVAPDVWNALIIGERLQAAQEIMLIVLLCVAGYFHVTRLFSFHLPLLAKQGSFWKGDAILSNFIFVIGGILIVIGGVGSFIYLPNTVASLLWPEVQVTRDLIGRALG